MTTESTKAMKSASRTTTSRPKRHNTDGITQVLLLGSVLATLIGSHLLARQDQAARPAAAQAGHTLVVPAVGGTDGMTLHLQPVPTVAPAPQLPRARAVARTRSSR